MKYPITPEFMYSLPLPLMRLYQRLEEQILEDICSRVAMTGEMTETAIEHIRSLQRRGYDYKKINEYIRKTLKLTQSEFDTVWNKAVQRNQQYFDTLIDDNLILGENNFNSDLFMQEINAIEMQTLGELTNITRSMGFAYRAPDGTVKVDDIGRMYQRVLDDALMRVESGQSYNVAIRDATKMLTDSGLQYVDYESGWHNRVDVAARRAVMTGVTQLSRQYTEQTATLLDTPYREVTAHRGARDGEGKTPWASHKKWQGRVYSVRTGDIYPSIYEVCGLGEVDGLCGANCRHMYHIWIEGVSERTYTDEELENIDPPPFEFEGKQYTFYEATQKQRQVEASLRKVKRELIAAKGRGDDEEYTTKAVRYRRLNEEYEAFSKAAGLRPQYERGNIAEFGPKEAREAQKAAKNIAKQPENGIIKIEVDELTPCLKRMNDGQLVNTTVVEVIPTKRVFKDWEFDWTIPRKNGYTIRGIKADGDNRIQGLIALKPDPNNYAVKIDIVEAAPFNNPHNPAFLSKEYSGVGGHLFAEAVRESFKQGFDGYVYFTAKSDLIKHYQESLGATLINPRLRIMAIEERSAKKLYDRYYGGESS